MKAACSALPRGWVFAAFASAPGGRSAAFSDIGEWHFVIIADAGVAGDVSCSLTFRRLGVFGTESCRLLA